MIQATKQHYEHEYGLKDSTKSTKVSLNTKKVAPLPLTQCAW